MKRVFSIASLLLLFSGCKQNLPDKAPLDQKIGIAISDHETWDDTVSQQDETHSSETGHIEGDEEGISSGEGGLTGGSSSVAGNPLGLNLKRGVALIVTESQDDQDANLLMMTEEGTVEEVTYHPEESRLDQAELPLPPVREAFTGPEGLVVLLFQNPLMIQGESCALILASNEGTDIRCLDPEVTNLRNLNTAHRLLGMPGGHRSVQFDHKMNIFYATSDSIRLYDSRAGKNKILIDSPFSIDDFVVSTPAGLFVKGGLGNYAPTLFHKSLDGPLEPVFDGYLTHFDFWGEERLLFSGDLEFPFNQDQLFLIPLDDEPPSLTTLLSQSPLGALDISYHFYDFQGAETEEIFALSASSEDIMAARNIYRINSGGATLLETAIPQIGFFQVVGHDLYVVGQSETGQGLFHKLPHGNNAREIDLLEGKNIEITQFVVMDSLIYFIGSLPETGESVVGKIVDPALQERELAIGTHQKIMLSYGIVDNEILINLELILTP